MQIPLQTPTRKTMVVAASLLVAVLYTGVAATSFLAFYFSEKPDLLSLQRAVRLQPGNGEYRFRVGRNQLLVQRSPEAAAESFQAAAALNPYKARYWLDLAAAYQAMDNLHDQKNAVDRAVVSDPKTPEVAWDAANFYLVQGDQDKALREFHVVLENDPSLAPAALRLCWRMSPDVDAMLNGFLPPNPQVYYDFLDLLMAKKETASAAKVWAQLAQLNQPLQRQHVFDYFRYLIAAREVDQARTVWQQAATPCDLTAYQPSAQNLVINGDFSLNVLNGGFDWLYQKSQQVSLALDPAQSHSGQRSLLIGFDARGIDDAGIRQLIPVHPNASYDFSAYFKAENIQGAGGPRFAIQDVYTGTLYFASEELKDAVSWKPVSGAFTVGADTKLVVLRVQRIPAGSPIKGKLWIDEIRLTEKH